MNKLLKSYIPGLSIAFTFTVLYSSIIKLASGDSAGPSFLFMIIEFAAYLLLAAAVDALAGLISFQTYLTKFLAETLMLYPITGCFAYWGNWFKMNFGNIIGNTVLYIAVMAGIHYYFYWMDKKEAETINLYLSREGGEEKNG